eukprot:CCRYP_007758-RC/>CCRYP_007758-RC protein AED:0.49 eAED:1.00 QI:0/0/0/1/0/0/2/0/62
MGARPGGMGWAGGAGSSYDTSPGCGTNVWGGGGGGGTPVTAAGVVMGGGGGIPGGGATPTTA